MARYELQFKPSVARDLHRIPAVDVQRILARIDTLRDDPRPPGSEKLSPQELYRLQQGDDHVLYLIEDAELLIGIV
jgi:mRNA interferase RelE/StbE